MEEGENREWMGQSSTDIRVLEIVILAPRNKYICSIIASRSRAMHKPHSEQFATKGRLTSHVYEKTPLQHL